MVMIDRVEVQAQAELVQKKLRDEFVLTKEKVLVIWDKNGSVLKDKNITTTTKHQRDQFVHAINGCVLTDENTIFPVLDIICTREDGIWPVNLYKGKFIGNLTDKTKLIMENNEYFIVPNNWFRGDEKPVKEDT